MTYAVPLAILAALTHVHRHNIHMCKCACVCVSAVCPLESFAARCHAFLNVFMYLCK